MNSIQNKFTQQPFARRLFVGVSAIGLIGLAGLGGCSGAPTDDEATAETSDAVTKSTWIESCADSYYQKHGLSHPHWLEAPTSTGPLTFAGFGGTFPALWTGVVQFPGEDGQRLFSMDDDEVAIKNCRAGIFEDNTSIFARKPWPGNPPGGIKIQKQKCLDMGCFWQSEHTSHPHRPCPGAHQHLYCYNWSEEKNACFLQKTKDARCTSVPEDGCPTKTHQCSTVCCPVSMNCETCLSTPGE